MPAWGGGEAYVTAPADALAPAAGVVAHVAVRRAVYAAAAAAAAVGGSGGGRRPPGVTATTIAGGSHVRLAPVAHDVYVGVLWRMVAAVAAAAAEGEEAVAEVAGGGVQLRIRATL